ncbi:MAG: PEGA domain-containing protein [Candidatus Caldatribacteriota bacterium]
MFKKRILEKKTVIWSLAVVLAAVLFFSLSGINFAQPPEATEKMKSIQIIHPRPLFELRMWLDKEKDPVYYPGERITIFFQVSQDSYVTIYNYDSAGRVKILFPNRNIPHNLVKRGEVQKIEGTIDPRSRPGMEFIQGFALTRPGLPLEKERELIYKEFIPEVSSDYQKHVNTIRGIINNLPASSWTVSNMVSFTVKPVTPPPPPPVNYGRVLVDSNPRGAKVYLDNKYTGVTPLSIDRVNSGQHKIKLQLEGYQDWDSNIFVTSNQTVSISADMIPLPQYGSISLYCNQGNAKIYLDGDYQRTTYANQSVEIKNVKPGYHQITIAKDGYQEWSSNIMVNPNQAASISVNLIPLPSQFGSISIYCNQGSAKIYLDGKYQRTTYSNQAVEIKNVQPGYHQITITKDGYQEWNSNILVNANQNYVLSAYLSPEIKYGSLVIYCNVNGAKIFLNGIYQTTSSSSQPKVISELKEKQYEITLVKDGYHTWVQEVWIYDGVTNSLYVEMQEIE